MPDNTQRLEEIKQAQKEANIENAIRDNDLFKQLQETLANFPEIRINIDDMITAYMDYNDQTTPVNEINYNIITDVIRGTIYSISKENVLVVDSNGNVDIEQTMNNKFMARYDYIGGLENLSEEDKKELISEIGSIVGIEKVEEKFVDSSISRSFSWISENETDIDIRYMEAMNRALSGMQGSAEIEATALAYVNQKIEENRQIAEQARLDGFIDAQVEAILFKKVYENASEEEIQKLSGEISKLPNASVYIDEATGKIDLNLLKKEMERWEKVYILEDKYKNLTTYSNNRMEDGKRFSDVSFNQRDLILEDAFCLFENQEANDGMRKTAKAILESISPFLINSIKDKNGNVSYKIDEDKLLEIYNSMRPQEEAANDISEIRNRYYHDTQDRKMNHLERLESVEKEKWMNREQYKKTYVVRNLEAGERNAYKLAKEENHSKDKLIGRDAQDKLKEKLDETLAILIDENGNEVSHERKVKTVMAAYVMLKESVGISNGDKFVLGGDVGNKDKNLKALELLEEHIKSDPISYGNFIKEKMGHQEFDAEEKNFKEGNIDRTIEIDFDSIKNETSEYKEDVELVFDVTREIALRELYKDESFRNKMSKDGIELWAVSVKDNIKHALTVFLNKTIGEEETENISKALKSNETYVGTRDTAYKFLKGFHKFARKTGEVLDFSLRNILHLQDSNKLALPSASDRVTVSDIDKTIRNARNFNYIKTGDELELIKLGIRYDHLNDYEKVEALEELERLPAAQKYVDKATGKMDYGMALDAGRKWEQRYSLEKRGKALKSYIDARKNSVNFDKIEVDKKKEILEAAFMILNEDEFESKKESFNVEIKILAGAVLEDISPSLISNDKGSIIINTKELMNFYNSLEISEEEKITSLDDLTKKIEYKEKMMASDKTVRLTKEWEEKGKFQNKTEYMGRENTDDLNKRKEDNNKKMNGIESTPNRESNERPTQDTSKENYSEKTLEKAVEEQNSYTEQKISDFDRLVRVDQTTVDATTRVGLEFNQNFEKQSGILQPQSRDGAYATNPQPNLGNSNRAVGSER